MAYTVRTDPTTDDGRREIVLIGKVYADAAAELRRTLADTDAAHAVLVDAGRLESIDAVALRVFLDLVRRLRPHGGKLVFFGLQPTIRRVFELTTFDRAVTIASDREDALRRIG